MGQADASDQGPLTSRERFKGATRSTYSNQPFDSEQTRMKSDSVKSSKRNRDDNISWGSHPNNIRSCPPTKTPIFPSSSSLSLPPCTQHQNAVTGHERPRRNANSRRASACLHIIMCSFATCLLLISLVQISTTNSFLSHVVMAQRPRRWPMLRTPFQDLLFGSSSDPNHPSDTGSGSASLMLGSVTPASKDERGGSSSKRHDDVTASPDGSSTSYRNSYPKESSSSNGDGSYSTSAKNGKGKEGADKSDPKQMDLELSASEKKKDNQEFILYSENADADSQSKKNNSNGTNKKDDSKSPSSSPAPAPAPPHSPSSGKPAPALPSGFKVPAAKATQSGSGPGLDASDLGKSNVKKGDWVRSRSTYYGGPDFLSTAYDPTRGKGSFGILSYGSCGYTNSDGSLPFPEDAVAAPADSNPDYPGSCGRCYLLKCVNGVVYANSTSPVRIVDGYFDGDYSRPYLPSINPNIKDTLGRSWPGNSMEADGLQSVKCWDENKVLLVRLIDSCPCRQVLSDKAPGVKKGGEVRRQEWCCGGQQHFDISYWAFEKLAHPVYGVMTVDMRPVDCNSQEALQFLPGYVSEDIYRNGMIQPGWNWFPYSASYSQLSVAGGGYGGRKGTCMTLSPGGGLKLLCRECQDKGYQPFKDADNIEMWIRPNSKTSDPFESSTPQGSIPPLKVFLLNDHEPRRHCKNEVVLNATASSGSSASIFATKKDGGWFHIMIPVSLFNCGQDGTASLDIIERMDFQNVNGRNAMVCFDKIRINRK